MYHPIFPRISVRKATPKRPECSWVGWGRVSSTIPASGYSDLCYICAPLFRNAWKIATLFGFQVVLKRGKLFFAGPNPPRNTQDASGELSRPISEEIWDGTFLWTQSHFACLTQCSALFHDVSVRMVVHSRSVFLLRLNWQNLADEKSCNIRMSYLQ